MKIQKPSLCRAVIYTATRGDGSIGNDVDEYAGTIVGVYDGSLPTHPSDMVDIVTHGSNSTYHNNGVRYNANGKPNTWRYPPYVKDEIEVDS